MKHSNTKQDEFKSKQSLFKGTFQNNFIGENPDQTTNHSNNLVGFAITFKLAKAKEELYSGKNKFNL